MTITDRYIVYPDGETQEIDLELRVNQYVDLNGFPIRLPLATRKTIVYRVFRVRRSEERGEERVLYFLELVAGEELVSLTRG